MDQMTQIQYYSRKNKTVEKAQVIAERKRVRKTCNHKIWIVGSGNSKTANKFYRVMYDEDLDEIAGDCKAYEIGTTVPCCHILAAAISFGNGDA